MILVTKFTPSYILPVLIYTCIVNIAFTNDQKKIPRLLVTRIVHHHSIFSPFFDPKISVKELADIDLSSSISRGQYLISNTSTSSHHIKSPLTPRNNRGFLAWLTVGKIRIPQFVYMDTGSSLLWINCEPCGFNVPGLIYDPATSPTYKKVNCSTSEICGKTGAVRSKCGNNYVCDYEVRYGSGDYSEGQIAKETFRFDMSHEVLDDIFFGCSKRTSLYVNGVLGLGATHLSLLRQIEASTFSYCIGNISDKYYSHNRLIIGKQLASTGYQTPLIIEDRYYVNLQSITIGDKKLDIDPKIFERRSSDYEGGMVIDTGSTYSFIPQVALTKVEEEVIKVVGNILVRNFSIMYKKYRRLCYDGVFTRDLRGFPTVSLEFEGDATMELIDDNVFHQVNDENFCLAFLPSEVLHTSISILGSLMQQYFYISYDVRGQTLSFQDLECDVIDNYVQDHYTDQQHS